MDNYKKVFWAVLILALVGTILVSWQTFNFLRAKENSTQPTRTITVSGDGKSVAVPDIATFSFTVVSEGADVAQITDENNKKINAAIAFLKKKGIDDKDIKTSQYNLNPKYDYDRYTGQSNIVGYTLSQSVTVKMRNFEIIGSVLSGVIEFGINQTSGLSFEVDDDDKYLNEARKSAFDEAKEKAKELARLNGVSLKRVITFSESSGYPYPIQYFAKEAGYGMGGDTAITEPTIEAGSQEVNITVSVTYEIE